MIFFFLKNRANSARIRRVMVECYVERFLLFPFKVYRETLWSRGRRLATQPKPEPKRMQPLSDGKIKLTTFFCSSFIRFFAAAAEKIRYFFLLSFLLFVFFPASFSVLFLLSCFLFFFFFSFFSFFLPHFSSSSSCESTKKQNSRKRVTAAK